MQQTSTVPRHVGIIMDGNRRWARQHKLAALQGHQFVADKVLEPLIERAVEQGISFMTLWAFSTENWHRDQQEVAGLMNIFRDAFSRNAEVLHRLGVKLQTIGDMSAFPADIQQNIKHWVEVSQENTRITVIFALNYGGRDEITRAVSRLLSVGIDDASLTEDHISQALDTAGVPDPDLIIRPGGEQRLSGFLTWQGVYAELYFTDVLMPDFSPAEFDKALAEYARRQRRFGT